MISWGVRARFAFLGLIAGSLAACFEGRGLVGAVCYNDNQCGVGQACVNSVCGLCNNRQVDPGELCFGASSEENVFGEVTDLLAYDHDGDGLRPLLIATVNNNCSSMMMMLGPPMPGGPSCWDAFGMDFDDQGDFEVVSLVNSMVGDGRIPQGTTGNFDGESTRDVALAIFPTDPGVDQSQLVVIFNLGLGEPVQLELDTSVRARTVHAADLDGDGLDDLLIGGESTSSLVEFIAVPTDAAAGGAFANERLQVINDVTPRPAPPADMDGDGDLDVVLVSPDDLTLSVYANDGGGNLSDVQRLDLDTHEPTDLALADFDQDGAMDAVVFLVPRIANSGEPAEVRVFRGLGDGTLELEQTLPGGERPVSGLATDINADGWPDVVVADVLEDKLPVHINRGGSFVDLVTIDVASSPQTLMHADFDRDGIADLVVGNANGAVAVVPSEN